MLVCVCFCCSPVAVAIYDYEAMAEPGEEDNLEFEEGDLIEVKFVWGGGMGVQEGDRGGGQIISERASSVMFMFN